MNINRDYLIILDVKSGEVDSPNIYYFNTDKNTSNLYIQMVIKETNIEATPIDNATNYSIKANILKPNMVGKIVEGNLVNEAKAIYEFKLPADCTDFSGNAKIEFEVFCTVNGIEEVATSFSTKFKVYGSILTEQNKYIEDSSDYPILKELMAEAKELNTQAKELNTDSRKLHEELSGALEAEEQRKANESIRISNENTRIESEYSRQSAEQTRITNEITRQSNEASRQSAEQTRQANENTRVTNENARKEAETTRITAETARAGAEATRVTAENNREAKENLRQEAEADRVVAEQAREASNTAMRQDITNMQNEISNFKSDVNSDIEEIRTTTGQEIDTIKVMVENQNTKIDYIKENDRKQDILINGIFNSQDNKLTSTLESNVHSLVESKPGLLYVDEIVGNTMVNCNKEADKSIVLTEAINEEGTNNITLTQGIDGAKADVYVEGNTMVNVCYQEEPVAITKSYAVETGNHVALQGEYDGKCRPVVYGNTLWIDNDTEEVLTAFDDTKNLRLQSSFEDKVVTQEMVDSGAELAENLGKYKVEYKVTATDKEQVKTYYLNSPLLEGDTIEDYGNDVVHVHRSELVAYTEGDELTYPTDLTNTLKTKASPTREVISTNDSILQDSYKGGSLDIDTAVPIDKVVFNGFGFDIKYLYPSTNYIIQFEADNNGKLDVIAINSIDGISNIAVEKGINKFNFTISSTITNQFVWISGIGFNMSNIVVTEAVEGDFGYFKGMKSVGEQEGKVEVVSGNSDNTQSNKQALTHEPLRKVGDVADRYVLIDGKWYIERNCSTRAYEEGDIDIYKTDMVNTVYPLASPTYEPIDYNPLDIYSDTTHISVNTNIPAKIKARNHGYNCMVKPNTTYTATYDIDGVAQKTTIVTPATLDDVIRFTGTGTLNNFLLLEGDISNPPAFFSGMRSCFDQEYDEEKGKWKVNIRVEGNDTYNDITIYVNEPLRKGDIIRAENRKILVERHMAERDYQEGDYDNYITDGVRTVYQLASPIIEEVETDYTRLMLESYENATVHFNSHIFPTSTIRYQANVISTSEIMSVNDEQDQMLIDNATQIAMINLTM